MRIGIDSRASRRIFRHQTASKTAVLFDAEAGAVMICLPSLATVSDGEKQKNQSLKLIGKFTQMVKGNNRPTQPLNGRKAKTNEMDESSRDM